MDNQPGVGRRIALKLLGTCVVTATVEGRAFFPLAHHPFVPQEADGVWAPRFLSAHENDSVAALAELIIPATDTPGARAARVNEYIDFVLSQEVAVEQEAFRAGLAWLDAHSQARFGRTFVSLSEPDQAAILTALSAPEATAPPDPVGVAFFANIKRRTIDGYYSAEIGMRQELQYRGTQALRQFDGCTHQEHLTWRPGDGNG